MAGTDHTKEAQLGGPAIILVVPQMGENIGKAARAMYNFGLTDLRMVAPRDGWPNDKAVAAASGADIVIEKAQIFDRLEEAVADLQMVYATTARDRHMVKPVVTPSEAAAQIRASEAKGAACGILFGGEKAGLKNEDVVLAQKVVSVPVNPAFASLNLAQAVLLMAYEWFQVADETAPESVDLLGADWATNAELVGLFEHLEAELDQAGFLFPPEKREPMVRNIRNILQRVPLTSQDTQTLRGIVKALAHGRPPRR